MDIHYNTTGISPACLLDKFRAHIHLLKPLFFLFFFPSLAANQITVARSAEYKRERQDFASSAWPQIYPKAATIKKRLRPPSCDQGKGTAPVFWDYSTQLGKGTGIKIGKYSAFAESNPVKTLSTQEEENTWEEGSLAVYVLTQNLIFFVKLLL